MKNNKIHKKNNRWFAVIFMALLVMLVGCKKESALETAAKLYAEKNYVSAETYFIDAIRTGENSLEAYVGYGFNELAKNDFDGAAAIFKLILAVEGTTPDIYGDDVTVAESVRRGLYESFLGLGEYKKAVDVLRELGNMTEDKEQQAFYKAEASALAWKNSEESGEEMTEAEARELITIITESINAGNTNAKNYRMRANLYYQLEDWDLWEQDEREIIKLSDYAPDEMYSIYSMRKEHKSDVEMLEFVDELIVYMNAHSDYMDSYDNLIAAIMHAADITSYVEYENNSDYYFGLAEDYLNQAEMKKNMAESVLLKYQIVIAEHKGKMELAYKLLGVYLEHCPDDEKAIKEKLYLENRIGVKE